MLERTPAALLAVPMRTPVQFSAQPVISPPPARRRSLPPAHQKIKPNGFTAGGRQATTGNGTTLLFGLECDFGKMDLSGSTTATQTYPCCAPTAFTVTQTAETSWLFTARPRVGWVFGNMFLFYGTAGGALTNVKYTALFTDTFATAHESASLRREEGRLGSRRRRGIQAIAHHRSVKGEYSIWVSADRPSPARPDGLYAAHCIPHEHFHSHRLAACEDRARGLNNFRF